MPCTDGQLPRREVPLPAHYDDVTGLTIDSAADVGEVYKAAFETCFMNSDDPLGPDGPLQSAKKAAQHEIVTVSIGTDQVPFQFRPAEHGPSFDPRKLPVNTGYVAGDIMVLSADHELAYPGGTVKGLHSALLWFGRDKHGTVYTALLGLQDFPSVPPGQATTITVLAASRARVTDRGADKRAVAFARFSEPSHLLQLRTRSASHLLQLRTYSPWVTCDPGCCSGDGLTPRASLGTRVKSVKR